MRKIIHIDMDAFYASVEQRDHPEWRGKPIAVGGSPTGRGVVMTASYEARKFGVRSAMSSKKALELCPELIFVPPNFPAYKEASKKVREIFSRYTDLVEPLSLDEAYLDVTEDKQQIGSAIEIARRIKKEISEEIHLTASAGVSSGKFVAKVASDMQKPDGLTFIAPADIERFMEALPVQKFYGVGRVTAARMNEMGLYTGADLKKLTEEELLQRFGKPGRFYYRIVRGIDNRPVQPHRESKSMGAENTFWTDLTDISTIHQELEQLSEIIFNRMKKYDYYGRTITLKVKYSDFKQVTRSKSFEQPVKTIGEITNTAKELLLSTEAGTRKVRLLGVSASNFGAVIVTRKKSGTKKINNQLTLNL